MDTAAAICNLTNRNVVSALRHPPRRYSSQNKQADRNGGEPYSEAAAPLPEKLAPQIAVALTEDDHAGRD